MSFQTRVTDALLEIAADIKSIFLSIVSINGILSNKQDTLVSGTNIKTINNYTVVGAGNQKILGSRVIVFGGTGTPVIGTNVAPPVTSMFYGYANNWKITAKTPPNGGALSLSLYISFNADLSSPVLFKTMDLPNGVQSAQGTIADILPNGAFFILDINSVNGAADWKLEILHEELYEVNND